ncbi:hypothetical protein B0H13DRAFT_1905916 [Mycena leptocephala]|nr:hypothetical protein B0H13DRAFT_1905916 [Mycena leptocephala]
MPKINGALLPNKACLSCKRRKTRCDPNSTKRSENCERPTTQLVRLSKRNSKATTDIDGLLAALAKLNDRLDFLEATVFGWTLPIHQVKDQQIPENSEEASNPWAEALRRRRQKSAAHQSLSGSTVYDQSLATYGESISAHASGSGFSENSPVDWAPL